MLLRYLRNKINTSDFKINLIKKQNKITIDLGQYT